MKISHHLVFSFALLVAVAGCRNKPSEVSSGPEPSSQGGTSSAQGEESPSSAGAAPREDPPLTAETCEVDAFSEAKKITQCIYDPPRGEFDFAYNEERYAVIIARESGYGSELELTVLDREGNQVGQTYTSIGKRMEYDPNVVGAPWGGFFVAYKFDKHGGGTDIRISGRNMGYDGKWAAHGFLATTNSTAYGIRLRRLDDKIGLWFKEYNPAGTREISRYLEVMDNKKFPKDVPGTPIPPLVNKDWLGKLQDTPGWPLTQKKAIRVVWADDRFGILARKRFGGGDKARFMFFTATCK